MTVRSKAYFLTGQQVTTNPKFRTNNKPTELTFADLFDSIPFKAETADTASESVHGLVKVATGAEVLAGTNTRSSYQLVVKPSHIPDVGVGNAGPTTLISQEASAGIRIDKVQLTASERIKYLVNLLYDTIYFKIDINNRLTMSNSFLSSWNALLELIDNDHPDLDAGDFPADVFEGGGVVNNGGVFTVDTDDSTMHIDPFTFKVQIKDGGVTLDKLQNLNAGEIIVAPTGGGTPQVISLLGSGKILVGTATGLEVRDINDYLLAINISDNSVKARKLDPGTLGDGITKDMAASDASKLKVNLSAGSSLEFDGGALQLENDDALPGSNMYYGTNESEIKGYHSINSRAKIISIEATIPNPDTEYIIDVEDDIIGTGVALGILPANLVTEVLFDNGSGEWFVVTGTVDIFYSTYTVFGVDYIEQIRVSGLTTTENYRFNICYTQAFKATTP